MRIARRDIHLNLDQRPTEEILAGLVHYGPRQGEGFEHACYYHAYVGIAKAAQPKSLLEIGVKLGYSLVAMFRGFPGIERIIGLDIESYVPDSQKKARENLEAAGYKGALDLPVHGSVGWSKKYLKPEDRFDLIHVDGDHSYLGAVRDMTEYWPFVAEGGVMIVDDLGWWDVMRAVVDTVPTLPGVTDHFHFPTGTGWRVLVK